MPGVEADAVGTTTPVSEAEALALAVLREAGDDRWAALVRLAEEALRALAEADARHREQDRWISRGYTRGAA